MLRLPRRLLIWGGAAVVALAGFAFMASNTIDASYAGEGSQTVSGYHVYDITYSGVSGSGGGQAGTMVYLTTPEPDSMNGIQEQDGVSTVSFKVSPDNALWTAVQLYGSNKDVIGGGGATNCSEANGTWTCNVTNVTDGGPVPAESIAYIDVEAVR